MNKAISQTVVSIILTALSLSASAWWNWTPADWMDEFMGGAGFSFSLSFGAHGDVRNRYYDYFNPYAIAPGVLPQPAYQGVYTPGLALGDGGGEPAGAEAESQTRAVARAVEAQRQLADRMASQRRQEAVAAGSQAETNDEARLPTKPIAASGPQGSREALPAPNPALRAGHGSLPSPSIVRSPLPYWADRHQVGGDTRYEATRQQWARQRQKNLEEYFKRRSLRDAEYGVRKEF